MPRLCPTSLGRTVLAGLTALVAATVLLVVRPDPAIAAVTHVYGYEATVLGFTSWYGSYGMGPLGTAWCIDHGIRAPDPAYQYVPTDLSEVPVDTRTAMAWAVGRGGTGNDPTTHAALMLVLHDLMGATYPYGALDVDQLTVAGMAGFGGHEGEVLALARTMKADGLAHRALRGSLHLGVRLAPLDADGRTSVRISLRDDAGLGVPGVLIQLEGPGAGLAVTTVTTDADGEALLSARPTAPSVQVVARTVVPTLALDAWESSTTPAQRVARPGRVGLTAEDHLAPPPTTTTIPPTTTTVPPTTTTTTTSPPSTSTTAPPPPVTVLGGPPAPPPATTLPRTGLDALTAALYGIGLVLIGVALLDTARGLASPSPAMGHHGGRGGAEHR